MGRPLANLFASCPNLHVTVIINFHGNEVRPAADGTIFDIFLPGASRYVERHDDFLAAPVAEVASFVAHRPGPRLELWRSGLAR